MITPQATLTVTMNSFPSERVASAVSRLVFEFCKALLDDLDAADRFYMAAQELAENLVKYSSGPQVSLSAELIGTPGREILQLRAKNHSTPEQLRAVESRLSELRASQDPTGLYDRLIRETAPHADGSGLGLARLRAEGDFDVDYSIQGSELTILVRAFVTPPARPEVF